MMSRLIAVALAVFICHPINALAATGEVVNYEVNGKPYEGYYVSPAKDAPLVLLIHDWDGLTDYEVKRADMMAEQGYAVFAADLFGAGVRPTEVKDRRQHKIESRVVKVQSGHALSIFADSGLPKFFDKPTGDGGLVDGVLPTK